MLLSSDLPDGQCFHCPTCACSSVFDRLFTIAGVSPSVIEGLSTEVMDLQVRSASLRRRIFDVLRHRNAMLPISRLPPEVLGEIFLYVRDQSSGLQWITVSHTHHAWRSIALSQQILWSTVDLSYSDSMVSEVLSRAASTPLCFQINGSLALLRGQSLCAAAMASAVGIAANAPSFVIGEVILVISAAAPSIRSIYVYQTDGTYPPLTDHILNRGFLAMDRQYTCLVALHWNMHIPKWGRELLRCPNLRTLTIAGSSTVEPDCPWRQIAEGLRALSSLEELKLHRCFPWVDDNPVDPLVDTVPFALTRLKLLDLGDHPRSCAILLGCLQVSSTCRTRIYCNERCRKGELTPLVAFTLGSSARIHGGYINGELEAKIFASIDYTGSALRYLRWLGPWRWDADDAPSYDVMCEVGDVLKEVEADVLSLVHKQMLDVPQSWRHFGGQTKARVVHIDWSVPHATDLNIDGCFSEMDTLVLEKLPATQYDRGIQRLLHELAGRAESDGRPRKLRLLDRDVPDDMLDRWREVVPDIERVEGEHYREIRHWARRMAQS